MKRLQSCVKKERDAFFAIYSSFFYKKIKVFLIKQNTRCIAFLLVAILAFIGLPLQVFANEDPRDGQYIQEQTSNEAIQAVIFNLILNNGRLHWSPVSNATGYIVYINGIAVYQISGEGLNTSFYLGNLTLAEGFYIAQILPKFEQGFGQLSESLAFQVNESGYASNIMYDEGVPPVGEDGAQGQLPFTPPWVQPTPPAGEHEPWPDAPQFPEITFPNDWQLPDLTFPENWQPDLTTPETWQPPAFLPEITVPDGDQQNGDTIPILPEITLPFPNLPEFTLPSVPDFQEGVQIPVIPPVLPSVPDFEEGETLPNIPEFGQEESAPPLGVDTLPGELDTDDLPTEEAPEYSVPPLGYGQQALQNELYTEIDPLDWGIGFGSGRNSHAVNGLNAQASPVSGNFDPNAYTDVTITLTGTATTAGTHTINLLSEQGTVFAPAVTTRTVNANQSVTNENIFVFRVQVPPIGGDINDLRVYNTFVPATMEINQPAPSSQINGLTINAVVEGVETGGLTAVAGSSVRVTLNIRGTSVLAGTHLIGITGPSGISSYPVSIVVEAEDESVDENQRVFYFTMPNTPVQNLALVHSFTASAVKRGVTVTPTETVTNGITATAVANPTTNYPGSAVNLTITLSGTPTATGTHLIGISGISYFETVEPSTGTPPVPIAVTAGTPLNETVYFRFIMPEPPNPASPATPLVIGIINNFLGAPTITTTTPLAQTATVGTPFSVQLAATGLGTITWGTDVAQPMHGWAYISESGLLTGTPLGTSDNTPLYVYLPIFAQNAGGRTLRNFRVNVGPGTLAAPVINIAGGYIRWEPVPNASSYFVYIGDNRTTTNIVAGGPNLYNGIYSLNLDSLNLGTGTHHVQLRAMGETTNYPNWLQSPLSNVQQYSVSTDFREINLSQTGNLVFDRTQFGQTMPAQSTVTITNSGTLGTGQLNIGISGANPLSFSITPSSIANISAGATGNTATFTIVPNNNLPVGEHNALVTVEGLEGNDIIPRSFNASIQVFYNSVEILTQSPLPHGQVARPFSYQLRAAGTGPITWRVTNGTLPSGISLSSGGLISGTPVSAGIGNHEITVEARATHNQLNGGTINSYNTRVFNIVVSADVTAPQIVTENLPNGNVGEQYSPIQLRATGTGPINWSASGLPQGLVIDTTTGIISGIPSSAGNHNVSVTATGPTGLYITRTFPLNIIGETAQNVVVITAGYNPTNIMPGAAVRNFTAQVRNQQGAAITPQPSITWSSTAVSGGNTVANSANWINATTGALTVPASAPVGAVITITATSGIGANAITSTRTLTIGQATGGITLTFNPQGGIWNNYNWNNNWNTNWGWNNNWNNPPAGATNNRTRNIPRGHNFFSYFNATIANEVGTLVRPGFSFDGWFIGNTNNQFTNNTNVDPTGTTMIINARWSPTGGANMFNQLPAFPIVTPAQPAPGPGTGAGTFTPAPQAAPGAFPDVPLTSWFSSYVSTVTLRGLFQGFPDGNFMPNSNMTRAMFTQVIYNMAGQPQASTVTNFVDISPASWYAAPVAWASNLGIVQGVGNNSFAPEAHVTREQMAVIIMRYVQITGITLPSGAGASFSDQFAISDWATDAVNLMQAAGIIQGRPGGQFDPQATATRAEVAAIFSRLLAIANVS